MPVVIIPTAFRGPTGGQSSVPVSGATVRECLQAVGAKYPDFLPQMMDASGEVHRFVKLFLNEEELSLSELDKPVSENDRVDVLAAVAGG